MSGSATGHRGGSGYFGADTVELYVNHGVDGRELLDGGIGAWISENSPGQIVADFGMGTGWGLEAMIKAGAREGRGVDLSRAMFEKAEARIAAAGLSARVKLFEADAGNLPREHFPDNWFGAALVVNFGCAVSSPVLRAALGEMRRSLKTARLTPTPVRGRALFTAPGWLEDPFLIDGDEVEQIRRFEQRLPTARSIDDLKALVKEGTDFHRATLLWDDGRSRARLVRNEIIEPNTQIWRIISRNNLVANFSHTKEEQEAEFAAAGFVLEKTEAHVLTEERRIELNAGQLPENTFGKQFTRKPAFYLFHLLAA